MPTPPPQYPAGLAEAAARATAEAARRWARSATAPRRGGRIITAATLAWEAAYPIAYAHGYTTLASQAVAQFEALHSRLASAEPEQRSAAPAVRRLIEVAQAAQPGHGAAPPPPHRVLETAAIAALARRGSSTAPEAITDAVHREAVTHGGMHGALTAATDINAGWRTRIDSADLSTPIGGSTLVEYVNTSFATLNRDFVTGWVAEGGEPAATPAALARSSFAAPAAVATPLAATPQTAGLDTVVSARRRSRS